ncbi:MAG: tagaturonate epimerase family protein [Sphaerochaeta sp.]|jgi:hypothetical protein|nr:tagaturonate epimerase family protein [Sphaerochaeta sp.]
MEVYATERLDREQLEQSLGSDVKLYPKSVTNLGECSIALVRQGRQRYLVACGSGPIYDEFDGEMHGAIKRCGTTHANRLILNRYLPYTVPSANTAQKPSIGLGDRLGEATGGHIAALGESAVYPIFAQQSIRELNFTDRTFSDVIDSAAWAIFAQGWTAAWGADGDHLKREAEVANALRDGATMITLDSSEQIDNTIQGLDEQGLLARYEALDEGIRSAYEERYRDKAHTIGDVTITLDGTSLARDVLIYDKALTFMQQVWEHQIKECGRPIDFEISIDETDTPTDVKSHLFIALELKRRQVVVSTLAPRFIGEFQKGIDYRGDLGLFEEDLVLHSAIARHFGYRLSVHSGSDKFSIFPILGRLLAGRFHIKTAGTNWLEAMRLMAQKDPGLYRRMHEHALTRFADATAFYHVTTDLGAIKPLADVTDEELEAYLGDDNARQLLHITYGYLLLDEDGAGKKLFRDEFFALLAKEEESYQALLSSHIGRHLDLLGFRTAG